MDLKDFLLKDYELKVRFLTDHLGRMWQRFNYFLAVETALIGGRVVLAPEGQYNLELLFLGFFISVIWYLMGAQDRYLAELYREETQETFNQLKQQNNWTGSPTAPLYHVGQVKGVTYNPTEFPTAWRIKKISTTRLAAWIPLAAAIFWAIWLVKQWISL